jgi:hypothetical protein
MTRFAPRFLGSGLGLVAALGVSANAYAVAPPDLQPPSGECLEDADCGHGFDCQSSITSSGGGFGGTGSAGGGSDPAGAGGTGTGGTASAGMPGAGNASGAPLPPQQCGNRLCELPENPTTCPSDCIEYRYCALAECDTASDCAEGYRCEGTGSVGTGGGPSAPVCGDGVCNGGPESEATCPEDCASRSFCTPESGYCLSDGDCVAGFYCSFYGSGSGSAGAGGSAGANTGGTAGMPEAGDAEAPMPDPQFEPNPGDIAVQGTCMPGGAGSAGTSGMGGDGGGGISTGGTTWSTGGTGAVSGSGGTGEAAGTGGTGAGGDPGTGARTGGGTTSNGGTTTTSGSAGSGGAKPNDDVVVTRGCSLSEGAQPSGFGSLVFAALALAGLRRRRARG